MAVVRKAFLRALLVVAAPLVVFGLVEAALFLTGRFEPLAALRIVRHEGRDYWTSVPEFGPFALRRPDAPRPHHVWLPVRRDPRRLRVVVLGESAVAGFPSEEYDLGRVIRAVWNERFPEHPMEEATVALVGVNSHALREMAIESLRMEPDVLVVYAGHNEVIGPYGPMSRLSRALPGRGLARLSTRVRNTRTGRALERLLGAGGGVAGDTPARWTGLDEHVDARMAADDPAIDVMLRQTAGNLRDIVASALRRRCQVLVCVPAVNLTDWPPLASAADADRSAEAAYARALDRRRDGDDAAAWEAYRRACDLDLLRLRADGRVRQLQRDLVAEASSPDVALVDADRRLHELNPVFTDDRGYFLEHVHLTFEGRVAVAALIVDGIARLTGRVVAGETEGDTAADFTAWWERFPALVAAVKERMFFTEFDEAYLWESVRDLLAMDVFRGLADGEARRRAAGSRAAELRDAGRRRWTTAVVEAAWRKASALDPSDGWIDLKAADTLAKIGDFAAARTHLVAAREKYPRLVQVHTALAHQAMRERRPAVALDHLADLDALLPPDDRPVELYAVAHLVSGNHGAAVPYLREIVRRTPDRADAWLTLAGAEAAAGRPADAVATCRRGLARVGHDAALTALLDRLLSAPAGR